MRKFTYLSVIIRQGILTTQLKDIMDNMQYRILVLLAHPSMNHSTVNKTLKDAIKHIDGVTLHDLYDSYPEFYIDAKYEQQLLLQHDLVVFQHPLYWYSTTPMLKLWQDVVFSRGFAYGNNGTALHGKDFIQIISTGGKAEAYQINGCNQFTIDQLMAPLKATAKMCGMNFHPPLVVHKSYKITNSELEEYSKKYCDLLTAYSLEGAKCFNQENI